MSTRLLSGVVVLTVVAVFSARAAAADGKKSSRKEKEKQTSYSVVQIDDDVRVIEKSELRDLKKQIKADYVQAIKDYNEHRKEALKAKEKFDEPRPKLARLKVISASVKTEEAANELRDKTLAKLINFSIVRVGEEVRVVKTSELAKLQKDLDDEYRKKLDAYNTALREAAQTGERPKESRPVKTPFRILATKIPTEKDADARAEKLGGKKSAKEGKGGEKASGKKDSKEKARKRKGGDEADGEDEGEGEG